MEERNAKIASTSLGLEGHGIPSFILSTESGCICQGFGNYDLRFYGVSLIMDILKTVGVEKWEDLPGTFIRVRGDSGLITAIGHIVEDKWLDMESREKEVAQ